MKLRHIQTMMYRVSMPMFTVLLLAACTKDNLTNSLPVEPGVPVKVSLEIKVPTVTSPVAASSAVARSMLANPSTAANQAQTSIPKSNGFSVSLMAAALSNAGTTAVTRSEGTFKLYNLWVFQFALDGTTQKVTKMPNTPEPVKDRVMIDVELLTGVDQTIYLVALGSEYSLVDLSTIGSKDELEAYTLPAVKSDAEGKDTPVITSDDQIPYCGSYEGLTVSEDANGRGYLSYPDNIQFTGAIPMTAMLARVHLDFSFQVEQAEESSMTLNKFPAEFPIKPSSSYKPTAFVSMGIKLDASTPKTPDGRYQFTWYVAPNPQGKVASITSQEKRVRANNYYDPTTPGKLIGDAPEDGTHIVIWAKHKVESRYVLYYLFLGGNLTDDFNLLPGSAYTMRTDIDAIDTPDDLRIVSSPINQTLYFRSSATAGSLDQNWLKVNKDNKFGGPEYDLDAHPSMRPIEIFVLAGNVKIEVTKGADWLHLSAYPNYTEAKRAQLAGENDGLTNIISVRAEMPTRYKFYIYSDEYNSYVHNDVNNYKRTATLRFNIATIDGTGTRVITTTISQRPAFLVGRVGGEFDETTGKYLNYLAYEVMGEYDDGVYNSLYSPSDYLPYYPTRSKLNRGFYGSIDWSTAKANYDVGNFYNGKKSTRLMAEGRGGGSITPNYVVKPTWTDGKLDLYQFDYNEVSSSSPGSEYGYGFVARACFDRNRDEDGSGVIEPNEYHWYMPSFAQHHIAITFNFRAAYVNKSLSSMYSSARVLGNVYTTTQDGVSSWLNVNTTNVAYIPYSSYYFPRCVRDLPVDTPNAASSPEQPKIEIHNDGVADYAAIDATGLKTASRPNLSSDYTNVTHDDKTASGANKAKYIYTSSSAGIRTIRHKISNLNFAYQDQYAAFVVSSRFMVAPESPPLNGGWAYVSGWSNAANSNLAGTVTEVLGCAAYKGRNNTDDEGTWRVPNIYELMLISLYDKPLQSTAAATAYKSLITTLGPGNAFWSSSEIDANNAVAYRPLLADGTDSPGIINARKTRSYSVRCIKDY